MNAEMRSQNYATGDYEPSSLFLEFFETVNGLECPHRLLHSDFALADQFELDDDMKDRAASRSEEYLSFTFDGPVDDRPLSGEDSHESSYERSLRIRRDELETILSGHADSLGRSLALRDMGVGRARAWQSMLHLESVDKGKSVAVGLPNDLFRNLTETQLREHRIVLANIINIAPKVRADILFSVFGVSSYHPLNWEVLTPDNDVVKNMFAILHMINLVEEGGLIFDSEANYSYYSHPSDDCFYPELLGRGILARVEEFSRFAKSDFHVCVTRLVRRPEPEEIREMLRVGKDNLYRHCGEDPRVGQGHYIF
ncbi:hypothetical protein HOG48_05260 [Candidatus Peregrinibacteria bacterium]|nr:hypothetical protein [Candidatus Peregrinibacteria bacterium]